MGFIALIGKNFLFLSSKLGFFTFFLSNAVKSCFTGPIYFDQLAKQMWHIGYKSLPVVGLTAVFTGAVLALQSYTGFSRFNAESSIASVVVLSITRELGPVLAGLMLAGRVSASIAAEIGTMKVTEQIDALYTLQTDPYRYLIIPRIISGIICMPILVLIADIIGVFGGYIVSVYTLDFNQQTYIKKTIEFLQYEDVTSGLIKAMFFGFIVTIMGCFYGYYSKGGAQGVGVATTNAVVSSSILILLSNYVITKLLFHS